MTLTTSTYWLRRAQVEKFAIGAFNANSLEQLQSIVLAAQEEHAPVIIQISHNAAMYLGAGNRLAGLRLVAEMGRVAAEMVDVPVVLHLDHGGEMDLLQALGLGFTSVMFDGSDLPFEENIATTKRLCEIAHEVGAAFEAELGEVPRAGVPGEEEGQLTDPAQVAEFAARTGVDALAVAVGSVHALKKKEVALDFTRLDAIHAAVSVPLVLHGSSGVLDTSICEGIRRGICKVNVATQLNGVFTQAVREHLAAHPDNVDPRKYLGQGRTRMVEQVRERMRLFGISGKAVAN
jgi:fructose-bisphosphate aldolase, class II